MLRSNWLTRLLMTMFICMSFSAPPAKAQLTELAIAGVFAGLVGTKIIEKLEEKFQSMNAEAQGTINLATGNATVLIRSALDGLSQIIERERRRAFEDMGSEVRAAIVQVYRVMDDIEHKVLIVNAHLKADMVDLMNNVVLLTEEVDFMITGIDPIALLWREGGDYEIEAIGVGVGLPPSNRTYEVAAALNGEPLGKERMLQYSNSIKLRLSYDKLAPHFPEEWPYKTVPLEITSTVTESCGFLWLWDCPVENKATIQLSLYPKIGGTVIIQQVGRKLVLRNNRTEYSAYVQSPDRHNQPEYLVPSPVMTAPDGWQITSAGYDNSSCQGPDNSCVFYSSPNCVFSDNKKTAQCTVMQGSHSKTFRFWYEIAQETYDPESRPDSEEIKFEVAAQKVVQFEDSSDTVQLQILVADGRKSTYSIRPPDIAAEPFMACGVMADAGPTMRQVSCALQIRN